MYPYLLKEQPPKLPDDVWCVDITYIKTSVGFVYLVALIDVVSRRVMGWTVSPYLETSFCIEALKMALLHGKKPKIINSDQGCQFTSKEWVETLLSQGIQISMDGKGRCLDNIWIERFWRSLKYEEVYLNTYDSVLEARRAIGTYIEWYNNHRLHQALGYRTPAAIYLAFTERKEIDRCSAPILQNQQYLNCLSVSRHSLRSDYFWS